MAGNPGNANRITELLEGAAAVAGQTDLTSVLYTTVETAMDLTGAPYGALGVLDDEGGLQEFIHIGFDGDIAEAIGSPPAGRGLLGSISRDGKTVRLDHVSSHPDFTGFPQHHPDMDSFLGVPVRLGTEIFGNLYLTHKEGGFTTEDEEAVEGLAVVAGAAINTARLQRRLRRLAVVEDRERIARDLHDAIIQDLFAVGLSLQAQGQKVVVPEVSRVIADTVERLDDAIASLRRFIFDLQPPIWTQRDLRAEVTEMIGQLSAPYEVATEVTFEGRLDSLDAGAVDDALQLVSEALSNSLRHAEADLIRIEIRRDRDEVLLIISDEGRGFDTAEPTEGMGLDNIQRRAERTGGEATVMSTPGAGTTVRIRLPM
jgi:signal transduction histidine kinase